MRGRKPTPIHLRLVKSGRRSKATKAEPARNDAPVMPDHLSPEAAIEWDRITPLLYAAGYVTSLDSAVLACYCQAYGRWQQAERALAASPDLTITTAKNNVIQNALVGIANKAMADMTRFASELGCSPVARSRITPTPPCLGSDPADAYLT